MSKDRDNHSWNWRCQCDEEQGRSHRRPDGRWCFLVNNQPRQEQGK